MAETIDAMEEAFTSLSSGESYVPQRLVTTIAGGSLILLLKPVAVDSMNRAAIKILTQKQQGSMQGIPAIVGVVLLIDSQTGKILSLMDGEYLTALRTGAAAGLATKYLAKQDARILVVFGCGAQGKTQLQAVDAVRSIAKVWAFDKNKAAAEAFRDEMKSKTDAEIFIAGSNEVLKECDVICTATNAEVPLFHLEDVKKGVHIIAIGSFKPGMQELDPMLLKQAKIFVDQKKTCLAESGDLIKPIHDGVFTEGHIQGELGDFLLHKTKGRISEDEITVFKSVGVAIQDFAVANKIYEKSKTLRFGQDIDLFN